MTIGEAKVLFGAIIDNKSFGQVENAIKGLKSFAVKALGAIGVGLSLKSLNSLAEQYQTIRDTIGDMTKSHEEARKAQQNILDTSKKLHKSFDEITGQVKDLIKNGKAANIEDALKKINEEAEKSGTITLKLGSFIQNMKDEFGLWIADLWYSSGVTERLGNVLQELFKRVMSGLNKARPHLKRIIDYALTGIERLTRHIDRVCDVIGDVVNILGGVDKVIELIGYAIGIIIGMGILKRIANLLSILNPVTLAFMFLIGAVQDFVYFMRGDNSALGFVFEKLGIDADEARENIKTFAKDALEGFGKLIDYISEHKDEILPTIFKIGAAILVVLAFLNPIPTLIALAVGLLIICLAKWDEIKDAVKTTGEWITEHILGPLKALDEWANNSPFIKFMDRYAKEADSAFEASLPTSSVEGMTPSGIDTSEVEKGMREAYDLAKSALGDISNTAATEGQNMMDVYAESIKAKGDSPVEVIKRIAENIYALIHHSTPDVGPLAGDDQWMPDMMQMMAEGINANAPLIDKAIISVANMVKNGFKTALDPSIARTIGENFMNGLASGIANGAQNVAAAVVASGGTIGTAVNSTISQISQNVNITNNFNGNAQANLAPAATKSAKDTSGYLANAIKFGR